MIIKRNDYLTYEDDDGLKSIYKIFCFHSDSNFLEIYGEYKFDTNTRDWYAEHSQVKYRIHLNKFFRPSTPEEITRYDNAPYAVWYDNVIDIVKHGYTAKQKEKIVKFITYVYNKYQTVCNKYEYALWNVKYTNEIVDKIGIDTNDNIVFFFKDTLFDTTHITLTKDMVSNEDYLNEFEYECRQAYRKNIESEIRRKLKTIENTTRDIKELINKIVPIC